MREREREKQVFWGMVIKYEKKSAYARIHETDQRHPNKPPSPQIFFGSPVN